VIEKLRLFLVIIEEGSLRRAAERLHISQSAVTRQIQLLEYDLGGQILERASSGVRPTIGGQTLARKARGLLADYDSVMAEIRSLVRGECDRLRIGYVASERSAIWQISSPLCFGWSRKQPGGRAGDFGECRGGFVATEFYFALAYSERGDGSDRRKASHVGFIHRMAKRENVQPFACLAGQFSTQGQVLREQVVQCQTRDRRDREG
jgi:molybdenum-dependent DNA-binding transcriptional regulator ModE